MFLSQFKETNDKEIEIKDTNIEAFKVFLKCIYFEKLDSNDIKDYSMAFDVYRLSHKYQTQELSHFIEQQLIAMIAVQNVFNFFEFGLFYESNHLLKALKTFVNQNICQILKHKLFLNYSFELIKVFLEFVNLSQNNLIQILTQIAANNPNKNMKLFQKLIVIKFCSIQDLNRLRNIRVFEDKDLNEVIEIRFENLNTRYEELVADYQRAKQMFEPFINEINNVFDDGWNYHKVYFDNHIRNFIFQF
jgi:hypothetical protein